LKEPTSNPRNQLLYLASANPGKLREFRDAAVESGFDVRTLPQFHAISPCVEDGATFEANATKKALHYSARTAEMVFADDSGICVDVLGGAPGIFSARFAGPDATDNENNCKLLEELRSIQPPPSSVAAHYVCVIALAQCGQIRMVVEGRADGIIISPPRGSGGFGYDPYFFFPPLGKTFAELTLEEKFRVSHRGAAFRALVKSLQESRSPAE